MEDTIKVDGMSCEHCEKAVKGAVEGLSGVSSATVHLETGNVDLSYDESIVGLEKIKEAVEDQGYDVIS